MSGTIDHVNVQLKIDSQLNNPIDLSTSIDPVLIQQLSLLTNGTASGQASQHFSDTRTIAPSGTDNIDLAGALVNAFGVTLTFTKIKLLFVRAAAGNTNNVQVTRPASNGFVWFLAAGDGFSLQPGAWNCWFDPVGITVTASTADILAIVNSGAGTSVTYDLVVIGTD